MFNAQNRGARNTCVFYKMLMSLVIPNRYATFVLYTYFI